MRLESYYLSRAGREELEFYNECQRIFNDNPHPDFLLESTSSFRSIVIDMIQAMHEKLLEFYKKVEDNFNDQSIKYVAFVKMYEEQIVKISGDKVLVTYEYQGLDKLPLKIDLKSYTDKINGYDITKEDITRKVDEAIYEFAEDLLGKPGRTVNLSNLQNSFEDICYEEMRGQEKRIKADPKKMEPLLKEIYYAGSADGKAARKSLKDFKVSMDEAYYELKRSIDNSVFLTRQRSDDSSRNILRYFDITVDVSDNDLLTANQNIMEIHRLYASLNTLYNSAYYTKLKIISERHAISRNFMNELINNRPITALYGQKIVQDMRNIEKKE